MSPRFDGNPARDVPAYRRMVPYIMRGRNESAVYFEQTVDLSKTLPWLAQRQRDLGTKITFFQLLLAALTRVLQERPRLNRFVAGRRLHDRNGIWISFAAKKQFNDDAPLTVVKKQFYPSESFTDMHARLTGDIVQARTDTKTSVDKEVDTLLRLPRPVLETAVRVLRALDFFDIVPRVLFEHDPMYTSVFVANLGSIKIDAAYHHLYEHGNCPLFVTLGKIERIPVVTDDDRIEPRDVVKLKYSYDERIEDGLYCAKALELLKGYLQDPEPWAR